MTGQLLIEIYVFVIKTLSSGRKKLSEAPPKPVAYVDFLAPQREPCSSPGRTHFGEAGTTGRQLGRHPGSRKGPGAPRRSSQPRAGEARACPSGVPDP